MQGISFPRIPLNLNTDAIKSEFNESVDKLHQFAIKMLETIQDFIQNLSERVRNFFKSTEVVDLLSEGEIPVQSATVLQTEEARIDAVIGSDIKNLLSSMKH